MRNVLGSETTSDTLGLGPPRQRSSCAMLSKLVPRETPLVMGNVNAVDCATGDSQSHGVTRCMP